MEQLMITLYFTSRLDQLMLTAVCVKYFPVYCLYSLRFLSLDLCVCVNKISSSIWISCFLVSFSMT